MAGDARGRIPDEELRRRLRDRLEREPDVLVAYLFGSRARGTPGALSDVDVAVLLGGDAGPDRRLQLIDTLGGVVAPDAVDVVVLNEAPAVLAYRVIRDGQLLVDRDERARVRHWAVTVDRYLDMAPMRRQLAEGLRHRLEEGRFGRP